jgi:hypothetical protein
MQRGFLTLVLLAAAAGTATAQTSSSSRNTPQGGTPPNAADAAGEQLSGAALTAKKAIERDGYRDVRGVAKGSDGLWHAQAVRGDTQVQVTVDRSGTVSVR